MTWLNWTRKGRHYFIKHELSCAEHQGDKVKSAGFCWKMIGEQSVSASLAVNGLDTYLCRSNPCHVQAFSLLSQLYQTIQQGWTTAVAGRQSVGQTGEQEAEAALSLGISSLGSKPFWLGSWREGDGGGERLLAGKMLPGIMRTVRMCYQ
jgi:hypothetical protein